MKYHTEADLVRDALAIVDPGACNASGVVYSLLDMILWLKDNGWACRLRQHPAIVLTMSQLTQLIGTGQDSGEFRIAYEAAKKIAQEEPAAMRLAA